MMHGSMKNKEKEKLYIVKLKQSDKKESESINSFLMMAKVPIIHFKKL